MRRACRGRRASMRPAPGGMQADVSQQRSRSAGYHAMLISVTRVRDFRYHIWRPAGEARSIVQRSSEIMCSKIYSQCNQTGWNSPLFLGLLSRFLRVPPHSLQSLLFMYLRPSLGSMRQLSLPPLLPQDNGCNKFSPFQADARV